MARRTRSFFFDNINKRLLTNTTKNTKESKDEVDSGTTSNTQFSTVKQVSQTIESTPIDDLSNVTITSLADDQILRYDSSTSKWKNETLTLTSSLAALTDTSITSLATNNYLVYNGSKWINRALDLSSYATQSYVDTEVAGIVDSAPAALNTLNELAAALGDDANFATTTATSLGNRLRIDVSNQSLTGTQKTNALTNLGITASTTEINKLDGVTASTTELNYLDGVTSNIQTQLNSKGTSSFSGVYSDLSSKPTIPTAQELSRTGLSSSDDLGSSTNAPLDYGWYGWGSSTPSNAPDNYALMFQLNDGGQPQQWVMAYGGSTNSVDLYGRRRTGGTWDTTWTKFWNSNDFSSTNVSNWDTAYGWGNHASAGYITSTVSGDLDIVGDVKAAGMLRGTGWWNTNSSDRSGYAVEIGWSGGEGYLLAYSRTNSAYGSMNFTATDFEFHTGAVSVPSLSSTGTLSWSGGHSLRQGNVANNIDIRSNTTGAAGIVLKDSGGSFRAQLYGEGTNYGFLTAEWGAWDLKKAIDGELTLRVSSANYTAMHTGNIGSTAYTQTGTRTMNGFYVGGADGHREKGIYGNYNSYRINNIWSMGTSYKINGSGGDFGNLYGMAYTYSNRVYTSNAMGGNHQMVWCTNGTPRCALGHNVWTSGNVTAYSDIRVKENLEIIPNALEKVKKLNGYTFDRTDIETDNEGYTPRTRQAGVVAQEVLEVLPEVVTGNETDPDGQLSVAYGNMVGLLIEAIKEQQEQIEELKARLQ